MHRQYYIDRTGYGQTKDEQAYQNGAGDSGSPDQGRKDIKPMYVLGLDGGGTKTDVLLLPYEKKGGEKQKGQEESKKQEEPLLRFFVGGINYNSFSKEEIRAHVGQIRDGLTEAGYSLRGCAGVGIGAAGISNPEAGPFLEEVFQSCGFDCPIRIVGDDEAALIGGIGEGPGLLLIAGTGSVCLGQDRAGRRFRAGGFGHLIDDGGSAYAIACDMLRAIVRASDGRGPETLLEEGVYWIMVISYEE
ncbi:MAG: hypothetical protein LUH53_05115, partial [Lachnospiraceae bacterium]|nr:hypothetical protein [Lachnospiraceae bacterium]